MDQIEYVHGLVLFTISNDELRESLREFIKESLRGEEMDESTYAIPRTGTTEAKTVMNAFFEEHKASFEETDFIKICYASALVNEKDKMNRDQIAMFTISKRQ